MTCLRTRFWQSRIAYGVSSCLHGFLLLGLWCWLPSGVSPDVEIAVAEGEAQVLVASFATPRTQRVPEEPEFVVEKPLEPIAAREFKSTKQPAEPTGRRIQSTPLALKAPTPAVAAPRRRELESEAPPPRREYDSAPRREPNQREPHLLATLALRPVADTGAKVDQPPRKLPSNPPPAYPRVALLDGVEGRVIIRATIDSAGSVAAADVAESSGSPLLDESALAAVLQWRFEPALSGGEPVEFEVLVPVRFTINRS